MAATELTIRDENGKIFQRSLITPLFTFFTDDADGIMMFFNHDPNRMPLCGYGAEDSLLEVVIKREWVWASEDMIYNIECILEENQSG